MPLALITFVLAVSQVYTQSDVVRLRSKPSDKAAVVAKLRINAPAEVVRQQGEWTELHLVYGAATQFEGPQDIRGWTHKSLTGSAPATVAALEAQLTDLPSAA